MNVDSDLPGRKRVFKINNGKLAFSRNTVQSCGFCFEKRAPDAPPLQLCGGCRSVRYCDKIHQKSHWPEHKLTCKMQQLAASQHGPESAGSSALPSAQERRYLVEDWKELHCKSIEDAVAWAINDLPSPFDFRKSYMLIRVKYRPESRGNPSLAFKLQSMRIERIPPPGTPFAMSFSAVLPQLEGVVYDNRSIKEFVNVVPCVYMLDDEIPWITAIPIYTYSLPVVRPSELPFYYLAEYCSGNGVVFRLHKKKDNVWLPGLMEKDASGTKWVWEEHTLEQLRAKNIYLSR